MSAPVEKRHRAATLKTLSLGFNASSANEPRRRIELQRRADWVESGAGEEYGSFCVAIGDEELDVVPVAQALADIEQAAEERGTARERAAALQTIDSELSAWIGDDRETKTIRGALMFARNRIECGARLKPAAGEVDGE